MSNPSVTCCRRLSLSLSALKPTLIKYILPITPTTSSIINSTRVLLLADRLQAGSTTITKREKVTSSFSATTNNKIPPKSTKERNLTRERIKPKMASSRTPNLSLSRRSIGKLSPRRSPTRSNPMHPVRKEQSLSSNNNNKIKTKPR